MARLTELACALLERLFAAATVLLLAAIMAINGLEIAGRSLLSLSLSWIHETNLLLASWMYFLGIYLVYRRGGDIAMVGLVQLLPQRARGPWRRLLRLVTAAVFLLVGWQAVLLIELQWPFRTLGVGYRRAAFTLPLALGAVAVGLESLRAAAFAPAADAVAATDGARPEGEG